MITKRRVERLERLARLNEPAPITRVSMEETFALLEQIKNHSTDRQLKQVPERLNTERPCQSGPK
jgi:hypothetical protein